MITVTVAPTEQAKALCTLTALKAELKVTASQHDDYLQQTIRQVSGQIAGACLRPHFARETVQQTEWLSVARHEIILARDLEPSISSITEDGVAVASEDYVVDGGLVYRLRSGKRCLWWPSKLVLTYQHGYVLPDGVPPSLERACVVACKAAVSARGRDPLVRSMMSADVGSESYRDPGDEAPGLPTEVLDMIQPFRRHAK
jgi:hypothetical protein